MLNRMWIAFAAVALGWAESAAGAPSFEISAGIPAVTPNPTCRLAPTSVVFKPKLVDDADGREEKPPIPIRSQSFVIQAEKAKTIRIVGLESFAEQPKLTFRKNGGPIAGTMTAEVSYADLGKHSVTVAGEVTLTDGTVLRARQAIDVRVIDIEIEVNRTADPADDLVQGPSKHPEKKFELPARLRLVGAEVDADVDVFVTNRGKQVEFKPEGAYKAPKNGDWVNFEIVGIAGSNKMDDVDLSPTLHSTSGPAATQEFMTVFWFGNSELAVTVPIESSYTLDANRTFTATLADGSQGKAVLFRGLVEILPPGLDPSNPMVWDFRVGLVQNLMDSNTVRTFDDPSIDWFLTTPVGTRTATYRSAITTTTKKDTPLLDANPRSKPLYHPQAIAQPRFRPAGGGPPITEGVVESDDTPTTKNDATYGPVVVYGPARPGGKPPEVGNAVWTFWQVQCKANFTVWCVVHNTRTGEIFRLKEQRWKLDVSSVAHSAQRAVVDGPAGEPTAGPVLDGTIANQGNILVERRYAGFRVGFTK